MIDFSESIELGRISKIEDWLIELRGEDSLGWLQGQITNDVWLLSEDRPVQFCICDPNGVIQGMGTLYQKREKFFVIADPVSAEVLVQRLQNFVVLEDVTGVIIKRSGWTRQRTLTLSPEDVQEAEIALLRDNDALDDLTFPSNRTLLGGIDCFKTEQVVFGEGLGNDFDRLWGHIPLFGVDIRGKVIPNDLGADFLETHVSMTKGCYSGQEIIHRIHSRAKPKNGWYVLRGGSLRIDEEVFNTDGSVIGKISSVGFRPGQGGFAGAWLKNENVQEDATLIVSGEPASLHHKVRLNS